MAENTRRKVSETTSKAYWANQYDHHKNVRLRKQLYDKLMSGYKETNETISDCIERLLKLTPSHAPVGADDEVKSEELCTTDV